MQTSRKGSRAGRKSVCKMVWHQEPGEEEGERRSAGRGSDDGAEGGVNLPQPLPRAGHHGRDLFLFLGKFSEACRAKTSTATRLHHPGVTRRGTRSLLTPSGSLMVVTEEPSKETLGGFSSRWCPPHCSPGTAKFSSVLSALIGCAVPTWQNLIGCLPWHLFLSLLRMFSAGNKATLRDYTGFITSKLGGLLRGKWLLLLFRAFLHSYPQKCTAKLNIVTEAFHLFIFIDWRHSIDQREPTKSSFKLSLYLLFNVLFPQRVYESTLIIPCKSLR